MRLWHYACSHGVAGILRDGIIKPNAGQDMAGRQPQIEALAREIGETGPVISLPVAWLTDLDVRTWDDAMSLGLQGDYVPCNRVEFRFRVNALHAVRWSEYSFDEPADGYRDLLELDKDPERWWVSETPIGGARLDTRYVGPSKPILPSYLQARQA